MLMFRYADAFDHYCCLRRHAAATHMLSRRAMMLLFAAVTASAMAITLFLLLFDTQTSTPPPAQRHTVTIRQRVIFAVATRLRAPIHVTADVGLHAERFIEYAFSRSAPWRISLQPLAPRASRASAALRARCESRYAMSAICLSLCHACLHGDAQSDAAMPPCLCRAPLLRLRQHGVTRYCPR